MTETLVELAEIVLRNIFQFNKKTLKQLIGTTVGTKFAPWYAILYTGDLEERILNCSHAFSGDILMIYF